MKKLLISLALVIVTLPGFAQELKYKSAMTINILRYINWSNEQKKGNFVIGVVAKSDLASILKEQTNGRKFGNQNIAIKEFNSFKDITPCQVIYIGKGANVQKNFEAITKQCGGKGFLLITESEGAINIGSVINFFMDGETLKYEVSVSNASKLGIAIDSKLLSNSSAIKK